MPEYKVSKYNHFIEHPASGKWMVYNSVSNGLATLESDVYLALQGGDEDLQRLAADPQRLPVIENLRSGHVIVEKDLDEAEFMRLKMNLSRYGTLGLSLTIVPTLGCNLACSYCYEGLNSVRFMQPEVQDSVVAFAKMQVERFGYRSVVVSWFGGEPLLRPDLLYSLSKKLMAMCDDAKVEYSAMVVTNGTRLTPAVATRLKELKVTHVQVTIDGPREVHDVRRPFKGGSRSSFDLITRNVDSVLGILPIHVRINVDRTNSMRSLEFVESMKARGWFEAGKQCAFYLGFTRVWTPVCNSIANQCFTMEQFSETEVQFQRDLMARGFTFGNLYPARTTYCVAAGPNGFVIDPDGELYKCWADVNNRSASVGNTRRTLDLNPRLLEWLCYEPLSQFPKCRDCSVFPICAGGCPSVAIKSRNAHGDDNNCTPWKILMREKIDVFLDQLTNHPASNAEKGEQHALAR